MRQGGIKRCDSAWLTQLYHAKPVYEYGKEGTRRRSYRTYLIRRKTEVVRAAGIHRRARPFTQQSTRKDDDNYRTCTALHTLRLQQFHHLRQLRQFEHPSRFFPQTSATDDRPYLLLGFWRFSIARSHVRPSVQVRSGQSQVRPENYD